MTPSELSVAIKLLKTTLNKDMSPRAADEIVKVAIELLEGIG